MSGVTTFIGIACGWQSMDKGRQAHTPIFYITKLKKIQLNNMDNYTATGIAEGFVEAENEQQIIEAWQHLHDTGLAYRLQGWFGRTCIDLIKRGIINE